MAHQAAPPQSTKAKAKKLTTIHPVVSHFAPDKSKITLVQPKSKGNTPTASGMIQPVVSQFAPGKSKLTLVQPKSKGNTPTAPTTIQSVPSHFAPGKSKIALTTSKSKGTISSVSSAHHTAVYLAEPKQTQEKRPHWADWVDRNAQPKNFVYQRPKIEPTRWQKRGPMSRRDWSRFYNWASEKAAPRPDAEILLSLRDAKRAKRSKNKPKQLLSPPGDHVKPKQKVKHSSPLRKPYKTLQQLQVRLRKLSIPRKRNPKYQFPPTPDYPFAPKINKTGPKKDRGRPFPVPKVPTRFQHIELEIDWWSKLRFEVRRAALHHKPTSRDALLAKPKVVPPLVPHCPIPEPEPEIIPKRVRMNYKQWKEHLRRLDYLAKPITGFGYCL